MPIVPKRVKKGKNKKDYVIGEDVYQEAIFYYSAAKILEQNRNQGEIFPPVLMNATFACELFSKSIIYAGQSVKIVKGHSLRDLYFAFEECDRELLKQSYRGTEIRFEQFIDEIADLFEFWRYRYEYECYSTHYSFVLEYMELLKKVADSQYYKTEE